MLPIEQIARVCHEAEYAYSVAIGDHSLTSWDRSPPWQKEAAIEGVKAVLAEPGLTPEQMHERWLEHKASKGWRYGAVKRPEALEHPCMVSYAELPPEQQKKDELFLDIVKCLSSPTFAWCLKMAKLEEGCEVGAGELARDPKPDENAVLTAEGAVVKGAEIESKVVPTPAPTKKGKKRSSDGGGNQASG